MGKKFKEDLVSRVEVKARVKMLKTGCTEGKDKAIGEMIKSRGELGIYWL